MEMLRARGSQNGVVHVPNLSANNLLQKFFITTSSHFYTRDSAFGGNLEEAKKKEEEEEEDDVELSLGLSLNGQFGTDPRTRKRKSFELGRSSSIPEGFTFDEQRTGGDMQRTVARHMFQLDRTCSLPVETEMEVETKRRRSEKARAFTEFQVTPPRKEENRVQVVTEKPSTFLEFNTPGPVNERSKMVNTLTTTTKKKKSVDAVSGMEKARNILEDMPCVSTRDVGKDGKRVEGFLYWYGGNKEEVKIVCVCHGSFLSPAEFVKHGGGTVSDDGKGGDVMVNPLRHIVVKLPSSSSL